MALIDFTRVHNSLLSSDYSVFNSTETYTLCAITLLLCSNNLIFSAFDAAVYHFLFNNPPVVIAVLTSLSVWGTRVRLSSRSTVSLKDHHRCDVSSSRVAQVLSRVHELRHVTLRIIKI